MKRASSLRLSRPKPIGRSVSIATSDLLPLLLCCPVHGGDDVLVAGTATDRARDRGADLVVGGVRVLVEQRARGHQHPGRAEAALERVQLVEALLDRIQLPVA